MTNDVPVWEKYALTIQEAADYFNIGEKKIRALAKDHFDDGFAIEDGRKTLIRRKKFEEFLDKTSSI